MSDDRKRAYNALLTLLDDDSIQKKQKVDVSSEPTPSTETTHEAVEGYEDVVGEEDNVEEEEIDIQVEDDNEGDKQDPFELHFAHPKDFDEPTKWSSKHVTTLPKLGSRSLIQIPENIDSSNFSEDQDYTQLKEQQVLSKVKHRLHASFKGVNPEYSDLQLQFASPLLKYNDVLITNRDFTNTDEYLNMTVLHMLNHVYKTRDRVLKNNSTKNEVKEDLDEFRDQGFSRPKALVILPTRNTAYDFVSKVHQISGLRQMEQQKRFKEKFKAKSSDFSTKPDDFKDLFAGNTNEAFCLGIKFTRQAIKLYTSFYASDLIIASPLGLRLVMEGNKDGNSDFLSSIEMCIVDRMDAIAMQAWTNIKFIFERLNIIPLNMNDCDLSRVREWYLDNKAKYLRQNILMTQYLTTEMLSLFNKYCLNVSGKFRSRFNIDAVNLKTHIHQKFQRINPTSLKNDSQTRLKFFTNSLLPSLLKQAEPEGILLVAPNYTDFVVLRNYLERNDFSYVSMSEYSTPSQIGRGRTFFANKKAQIMLYSARLHHYRRYGIKGTRTVVFYGLPDNPEFYTEITRFLGRTVIDLQIDPDLLHVHALYSKWDALKLERIVGSKRVGQFIEGVSDTYELY